MTDARTCLNCGLPLNRKQWRTQIESITEFLRRKFCGMECREAFAQRRQPGEPTEDEIQRDAERIREAWPAHRLRDTEPAPVETQVIYLGGLEKVE